MIECYRLLLLTLYRHYFGLGSNSRYHGELEWENTRPFVFGPSYSR